jgi:glycerol-3-phosphate dehydrogenase
MPSRLEMWERLEGEFDVLVVGGGINGCGIARDAAMRGLKVALVEMQDFAFGTSSRSSKLVHGGLRYLEQYEFSLVFEAVSERRILMDIAPHLVHPLGLPVPGVQGLAAAAVAAQRGHVAVRRPVAVPVAQDAPQARPQGRSSRSSPRCARTTSRARRCTTTARPTTPGSRWRTRWTRHRLGAVVCSHTKVVSFLKDESGRLVGAVVEDAETGAPSRGQGAGGGQRDRPVDRPHGRDERAASVKGALLRPTKGVHIVVPTGRAAGARTRSCASTRSTGACCSPSRGAIAPTSAPPTPTTKSTPRGARDRGGRRLPARRGQRLLPAPAAHDATTCSRPGRACAR